MSKHAEKCKKRGYPITGREVEAMHELHKVPYTRAKGSHSKSKEVGVWYDGELSPGVRRSLAKRMKAIGWLILLMMFVFAGLWLCTNIQI